MTKVMWNLFMTKENIYIVVFFMISMKTLSKNTKNHELNYKKAITK